jgi:hypothetical protein
VEGFGRVSFQLNPRAFDGAGVIFGVGANVYGGGYFSAVFGFHFVWFGLVWLWVEGEGYATKKPSV